MEPLLHMGLDPFVKNDRGLSAFESIVYGGSESQIMALHQLSLSHGVYDEMSNTLLPHWVQDRMMRAPEVFDSMVANVVPHFYHQMLLPLRIIWITSSVTVSKYSPEVVRRLLWPQSSPPPDNLFYRSSIWPGGPTILQEMTKAYFKSRTQPDQWIMKYLESNTFLGCMDPTLTLENQGEEQLRLLIRDIVAISEHSDLSTIEDAVSTTALIGGIQVCASIVTRRGIRRGWTFNARKHRVHKYYVQLVVRDWLKELREVGKDLEVFGQAELMALRDSGGARSGWKGFTVGPRPEDWHLIWEWDPDVEGLARDFWESVENPPLAIPGSWVDDDDDDLTSDEDTDEDWDDDVWRPNPQFSGPS